MPRVTGQPGACIRRRALGRPRAFTLVEMLVSLAVLTLALSVVGVVFSIATQSATQTAAYNEANNWMRQLLLQLEADLDACDPAQSVLVLVGRRVPAALTQADLEAGRHFRLLLGDPADAPTSYDPDFSATANVADLSFPYSDPRADLLMFVTKRAVTSQAPARNPPSGTGNEFQQSAANGAKFSPIQVVYGHAALDRVQPGDPPAFADNLRHIESNSPNLSPIPANQWHLSRRAAIFDPTGQTATPQWDKFLDPPELERLKRCYSTDDTKAGDVVSFLLPEYLAGLGAYTLTNSAYDDMWNTQPLIRDVLYGNAGVAVTNHHVATVLEQTPYELRSNLGVQMAPGCVWFEVEFLMPEDPRNSVQYSWRDESGTDFQRRSDKTLWTAVEPGKTYAFVPDSTQNRQAIIDDGLKNGLAGHRLGDFARLDQKPALDTDASKWVGAEVGGRLVRTWPYAIRITVRAYDTKGKLTSPIVRSLVHRFE